MLPAMKESVTACGQPGVVRAWRRPSDHLSADPDRASCLGEIPAEDQVGENLALLLGEDAGCPSGGTR